MLAGVQSDFDSSLAGMMIIAVDGAGTSGDSLQETRMMINESLERGMVRLQLSLGIKPRFCKKT